MKILFVIENIFFGGGERVFAQIIAALDKQKFQVCVASLPGGLFEDRIKDHAKILPFDLRSKFNIVNISRLAGIIKENGIDIIHCQGGRGGFFARLASHKTRVPLVCTIAMPVEGFNVGIFKKILYVFLDRFSEKYVDKFIVLTQALRNILIKKHKINPDKIIKITNGVEIEEFSPDPISKDNIRKEFSIGENCSLIGFIGRLTWQKGLPYFLQAIKEIDNTNPGLSDFKYLIVGDGEQERELKTLADSLNISKRIIFAGFRKNIKEIISALDVLVLPSLREGQPIILLEAMCMAKAIVTTNIEGMSETITNNDSGIIVDPMNAHALSEAIINLVKNKAMAQKLGMRARLACINNFNLKDKIAEQQQLYESIIGTRIY